MSLLGRSLTLGLLAAMLLMGQGRGQPAPYPSQPAPVPLGGTDILQGRQRQLEAILTTDPPGTARWIRMDCAFRDSVTEVAKGRAEGRMTAPDAGAGCVAALTRQAHDGALMALYHDILRQEHLDSEPPTRGREALLSRLEGLTAAQSGAADPEAAALPQRIVSALRDGSKGVDLGAGHMLVVTPGLAFDVGFSRAFRAGPAARLVAIDPDKLRAVTEACVGQREDAAMCFTAGYAQGGAVFRAGPRSSAR